MHFLFQTEPALQSIWNILLHHKVHLHLQIRVSLYSNIRQSFIGNSRLLSIVDLLLLTCVYVIISSEFSLLYKLNIHKKRIYFDFCI